MKATAILGEHVARIGEGNREQETITFEAIPYFWELYRDGKMSFTIREYDKDDPRFQALEKNASPPYYIKFVNTETGASICRFIEDYEQMDEFFIIYFSKVRYIRGREWGRMFIAPTPVEKESL